MLRNQRSTFLWLGIATKYNMATQSNCPEIYLLTNLRTQLHTSAPCVWTQRLIRSSAECSARNRVEASALHMPFFLSCVSLRSILPCFLPTGATHLGSCAGSPWDWIPHWLHLFPLKQTANHDPPASRTLIDSTTKTSQHMSSACCALMPDRAAA